MGGTLLRSVLGSKYVAIQRWSRIQSRRVKQEGFRFFPQATIVNRASTRDIERAKVF